MKHAIACLFAVLATAVSAGAQNPPGQDWWLRAPTYRSKHYNIKTDFPPADAKPLAEHMDFTFESYWSLLSRLPIRLQRPAMLDLYLFANRDDYQNVLRSRFHSDGTGSWGMCITVGNTISLVGWRGEYSLEQMKPLLQHEGFHQVASQLFAGLPPWANEGLAELFERGVMVDGQLVLGDFPPQDRHRLLRAIAARKTLPLERLLTINGGQWNEYVRAEDATLLYLEAWSLVHFLVFAEQGKYESGYLNFLVMLNRGADWRQAFVASFGIPDFKALEAKWLTYIQNTPASNYRETIRRLKFLTAGMLELHKQGCRVTSIDELRQQLQERSFESVVNIDGQPERLSATDAELFEVPLAEGVADRKFVLVEPRGRSRDAAPGNLRATGLEPQIFTAECVRRGREYEYVFSATRDVPGKTRSKAAANKSPSNSRNSKPTGKRDANPKGG
jgi:hypothetical protein